MKVNNREVPHAANSIPEGVRQRIEEQVKIKDTKDAQGQPVLGQVIEISRQLKIAQAEGLLSRAAANREAVFGSHPTGVVKGWEGTAIQPLETEVRVDEDPSPDVIKKLLQQNADVIARAQETGEGPEPAPEVVAKIFANANAVREIAEGQDPSTPSINMAGTTISPLVRRSRRRP